MTKTNRLEKDMRRSGLCGNFHKKDKGNTQQKPRRIYDIAITPSQKNQWTVLWDNGHYQDVKCGQLCIEKDVCLFVSQNQKIHHQKTQKIDQSFEFK